MTALLIIIALALWVLLILGIILFLKGANLYDSDYFEALPPPKDKDLD